MMVVQSTENLNIDCKERSSIKLSSSHWIDWWQSSNESLPKEMTGHSYLWFSFKENKTIQWRLTEIKVAICRSSSQESIQREFETFRTFLSFPFLFYQKTYQKLSLLSGKVLIKTTKSLWSLHVELFASPCKKRARFKNINRKRNGKRRLKNENVNFSFL